MRFIIKILINSAVLIALAGMFPNMVYVDNFGVALLAGMFIAVFNGTIRPILQIIALPISLLTFGLFSLLINGVILEIAINMVGNQIQISGFLNVVLTSIVLSFVQTAVFNFLNNNLRTPL